MKTSLISLLACTSMLHADDEASNYLNFIIQTQNDENQTQHLLNLETPAGNGTAPKGITGGSSVFSLWTIHRAKLAEYLLDEKTVSSYHPEASIQITTQDPYQSVPRTRVDHPFTVEYTVDGLVTDDPRAQDAAKSVIVTHQVVSYGAGKYRTDRTAQRTTTQGAINENGTESETRISSVTAPDLTQARGEEVFTIYARPDFGATQSRLARCSVQIWPIAQASITGIEHERAYITLPSINIDLKDLYPDSTTYVRVYEGAPRPNPETPHIINSSYTIISDVTPQKANFVISGKETGITQSGDYTLEVIHETPFGKDVLAQTYPLTRKNNIKVVGGLNTSE